MTKLNSPAALTTVAIAMAAVFEDARKKNWDAMGRVMQRTMEYHEALSCVR